MKKITNHFKKRLKNGEIQYGVWNAITDTIVAEILAGAGFDYILIDAEHGPFDLRTIQLQLQAIKQFDVPVVVRPPVGEQNLIKQLMDIGVQSLLVPMVETGAQADACAGYMRYPPDGVRGVGTSLARAAQWDKTKNYLKSANDEMCLMVQVETVKGTENLDDILQVENIDGVFIGPADLGASMGLLGQPNHPEVVAQINLCLDKISASGKKAGILTSEDLLPGYMDKGATMIGVGADTILLSKAALHLARYYKPPTRAEE